MRMLNWITLICFGVCTSVGSAAPEVPRAATPAAKPAPGAMPAAQNMVADHSAGNPTPLPDPNLMPIDLGAALRLAGVENPEILIAQQRVVLAVAERQFAAAQ